MTLMTILVRPVLTPVAATTPPRPGLLVVLVASAALCWTCGCQRSPEEPPADAAPGAAAEAAVAEPPAAGASTPQVSGKDDDAGNRATASGGDAVKETEAAAEFWENVAEKAREFERSVQEAADALASGDRERAHELYDALLARSPRNATLLRAKVGLCREDGRHPEALQVIDRALADDPRNSFLLYQKALVEVEMGAPDDALESIELAVATGDRVTLARYLRATILALRDDRDGALLALEDSLESGFLDARRLEEDARAGGPYEALREEPRFQAMLERLRALGERNKQADAIARHLDSMVENQRNFRPPPPENTSTSDAEALLRGVDERLESGGATELAIPVLSLVDGRQLALDDLRGKPVVLHVWGLWSPTARGMLPDLARLEEELRETGLVVVTLCYEYMLDERTTRGLLDTFIATGKERLRTAIISPEVLEKLGVDVFPTTLFLGRDTKVYSSSTGKKSFESMRRIVERLAQATSGV